MSLRKVIKNLPLASFCLIVLILGALYLWRVSVPKIATCPHCCRQIHFAPTSLRTGVNIPMKYYDGTKCPSCNKPLTRDKIKWVDPRNQPLYKPLGESSIK